MILLINSKELQILLNIYNLIQVINFLTRIGPTTFSLIDNWFLDKRRNCNLHLYPAMNGLSDHDGQILILENFKINAQNKV